MSKSKDLKNQLSLLKEQKEEIKKISNNQSQLMLKEIETNLLNESAEIVHSVMQFARIGFDENGQVTSIPFEWEGLPEEERRMKVRLAEAGWRNSSEFPHGAKLAHATMVGIIKARAQENSGTKILNIESASFPDPAPLVAEFETIEVQE